MATEAASRTPANDDDDAVTVHAVVDGRGALGGACMCCVFAVRRARRRHHINIHVKRLVERRERECVRDCKAPRAAANSAKSFRRRRRGARDLVRPIEDI